MLLLTHLTLFFMEMDVKHHLQKKGVQGFHFLNSRTFTQMTKHTSCFKSSLSWIVKKIEAYSNKQDIGIETPNALLMVSYGRKN